MPGIIFGMVPLEQQGRSILRYAQGEFYDYLQCGRIEHGFLRVRCEDCHYERLMAFSFTKSRRPRRATRHSSQLRRQTDGRECRAAGRPPLEQNLCTDASHVMGLANVLQCQVQRYKVKTHEYKIAVQFVIVSDEEREQLIEGCFEAINGEAL